MSEFGIEDTRSADKELVDQQKKTIEQKDKLIADKQKKIEALQKELVQQDVIVKQAEAQGPCEMRFSAERMKVEEGRRQVSDLYR